MAEPSLRNIARLAWTTAWWMIALGAIRQLAQVLL